MVSILPNFRSFGNLLKVYCAVFWCWTHDFVSSHIHQAYMTVMSVWGVGLGRANIFGALLTALNTSLIPMHLWNGWLPRSQVHIGYHFAVCYQTVSTAAGACSMQGQAQCLPQWGGLTPPGTIKWKSESLSKQGSLCFLKTKVKWAPLAWGGRLPSSHDEVYSGKTPQISLCVPGSLLSLFQFLEPLSRSTTCPLIVSVQVELVWHPNQQSWE